MTGLRYYIPKDQAKLLRSESRRLGIDIDDVIKMRLERPDEGQTLKSLQETLEKLTERMHRYELILMQFCSLNEAQIADLGYLRGAIEVQASKNQQAVKRAEEIELRRLQTAKEIGEKIGRYL